MTTNCQGWMLPPLGAWTAASNRSIGPPRSAPLEDGRPLLAERRERLAVVLALESEELECGRDVEGDVDRVFDELVDGELRVADGERGTRGQAGGERHGLRVELGGGHDAVHETDSLRFGSGERVAGEQ